MKKTKGFSQEWEKQYSSNSSQSQWPWADLISLVHRFTNISKNSLDVLELGCGYGANIPLFIKNNANYFGIDGSKYVINDLKSRFKKTKHINLKQADFTKKIPFNKEFDLIFDRGSLTCNQTLDIKKTITLIDNHLKKDGIFIGVDWFSIKHSEYKRKDAINIDKYTLDSFNSGVFKDLGHIHFTSKKQLEKLFKDFNILYIEHKTSKQEFPNSNFLGAAFNFVVSKKNKN